jgi:drug/metabolite transporter (DMT)-like permease
MNFLSITLILIAAVLHVGWNILLKQAREKHVATWWALTVVAVVFIGILLAGFNFTPQVWMLIVVSGAVEAGYFVTLASAYRRSDFSMIYPLGRGAAPVFLAIWAALFLRETFAPLGLIGLIVLIGGLLIVGSSAWRADAERPSPASVGLAILVALFISIYTAIDGYAVRQTDAIAYTFAIYAMTAVWIAPFWIKHYGLRALADEWRADWKRIIAIGTLSVSAYLLVTFVYATATLTYAGALREISVVFGALAGSIFFGEPFGKRRTIGSAVIFIGILLIALGA